MYRYLYSSIWFVIHSLEQLSFTTQVFMEWLLCERICRVHMALQAFYGPFFLILCYKLIHRLCFIPEGTEFQGGCMPHTESHILWQEWHELHYLTKANVYKSSNVLFSKSRCTSQINFMFWILYIHHMKKLALYRTV